MESTTFRDLSPPVAATLSLLGLLGYERVPLRKGLGVEFYERTEFLTLSPRSYVR